jgi:L-threonylcarbamoyladenylate synthase
MFLEKTEIHDIDPATPDEKILQRATEVILGGGIVVYPTDTLYGFGVDATNLVAMNRLYELKGRDDKKPVSLIIKNLNAVESIVGKLDDHERKSFKKLFPGKITLVLKKRKNTDLPKLNHFPKIGFRIPHYQICKSLAELSNCPITSTSVNISTKDSLSSIKEIKSLFNNKVDLILNVGSLKKSKGSTVIDLSGNIPVILRAGDVSQQELENKLGYEIRTTYPDKFVITFVCSGNICRSPMAEAILKEKVKKSKYRDIIEIGSAGTLNINGSHPTIETLDVSHDAGLNLTAHKSRGLIESIIRESNLVICMALDHVHFIQENFPEYRSRARLLKQMNVTRKLSNPSVPDPIGRSLNYYDSVFKQISDEINRITPAVYNMVDEFLIDTGKKSIR